MWVLFPKYFNASSRRALETLIRGLLHSRALYLSPAEGRKKGINVDEGREGNNGWKETQKTVQLRKPQKIKPNKTLNDSFTVLDSKANRALLRIFWMTNFKKKSSLDSGVTVGGSGVTVGGVGCGGCCRVLWGSPHLTTLNANLAHRSLLWATILASFFDLVCLRPHPGVTPKQK